MLFRSEEKDANAQSVAGETADDAQIVTEESDQTLDQDTQSENTGEEE